MNVFDPSKSMNAFAQGAAIGGNIRQRQTEAKLAPMVAAGDYKGAAQYAGQRGDLASAELYMTQYKEALKNATAEQIEQEKKTVEARARLALTGMNVPEAELPMWVQSNAPQLKQLGYDDQQIAQWAQPGALDHSKLRGYVDAARSIEELLKSPEFFAPIEVAGPDGKPQLAQFSNSGAAPRTFEGMAPYQKPETPKYSQITLEDGEYEYIPGQPESLRRLGSSAVKQPLVSVNMPSEKGENKFQEGLGSQAATNYQAVVEQGRAAGGAIGNLDTMEALLDNIDYTGFGGEALLNIQRVGAMFGAEIPDLAPKEALKRLSSQMALALKSDLPGPMSNADREFLLSIPPNLNVSPTGNDAILFILRKREERKQDMMRSLLQANPQTMEEYRQWENQYIQSSPPMFNAATQASLLAALTGASGEDSPQ